VPSKTTNRKGTAGRTPRRPSEAEQQRRQEERKATIEAMQARLDDAIAQLSQEERWVEMLHVISQFGARYSFNNQLLILSQCHERGFERRMVQGGRAWAEAGHPPRKGETALKILGPCTRRLSPQECDEREKKTGKAIDRTSTGWSKAKFVTGWRPVNVFDVAQVVDADAVAVPEPLHVRRRVKVSPEPKAQLLVGPDTTGALSDVIALIASHGLEFRFVEPDVLKGANGNTDGRTVQVRSDVDEAQQVKTAVHELAHNLLGHLAPDYPYAARRGRAETEAESVAYVVCGALGLDTGVYSAPYVMHWSKGDLEVIAAAATAVAKVAGLILAALEPEDVVAETAEEAEDTEGAAELLVAAP